jgi:hypothetical protein
MQEDRVDNAAALDNTDIPAEHFYAGRRISTPECSFFRLDGVNVNSSLECNQFYSASLKGFVNKARPLSPPVK